VKLLGAVADAGGQAASLSRAFTVHRYDALPLRALAAYDLPGGGAV